MQLCNWILLPGAFSHGEYRMRRGQYNLGTERDAILTRVTEVCAIMHLPPTVFARTCRVLPIGSLILVSRISASCFFHLPHDRWSMHMNMHTRTVERRWQKKSTLFQSVSAPMMPNLSGAPPVPQDTRTYRCWEWAKIVTPFGARMRSIPHIPITVNRVQRPERPTWHLAGIRRIVLSAVQSCTLNSRKRIRESEPASNALDVHKH